MDQQARRDCWRALERWVLEHPGDGLSAEMGTLAFLLEELGQVDGKGTPLVGAHRENMERILAGLAGRSLMAWMELRSLGDQVREPAPEFMGYPLAAPVVRQVPRHAWTSRPELAAVVTEPPVWLGGKPPPKQIKKRTVAHRDPYYGPRPRKKRKKKQPVEGETLLRSYTAEEFLEVAVPLHASDAYGRVYDREQVSHLMVRMGTYEDGPDLYQLLGQGWPYVDVALWAE